MSDRYLRLQEPPEMMHPGDPICGACYVEVRHDDYCWLCPSCGTTWPDGDLYATPSEASLYSEWAGDEMTGPVCPNEEAYLVSHLRGAPRDERVLKLTEKEYYG